MRRSSTDDEGAEHEEKTDGEQKRRRVTVKDPEETEWVRKVTEFMGRMEEWGKRREARGGSVSTNDGDGGPDDGEVSGANEGGFDGVEGRWGRRAGGRKRGQKGRRGG